MINFLSNNPLMTQEFGKKFAKKLKAGDVLFLYGDLGSGKTTFVKGLAEGMGIKKRVLSPTFVILRTYDNRLNHMDLYRIESKSDLQSLGVTDVINQKESILVVEWPEKLEKFRPKKGYRIYFKYLSPEVRKIDFKKIDG